MDSETGKLLSDVGIGGAAPGRDRGGAAQIGGPVATDKNYNAQPRGQNISMCGLLSLEFYRPYFDVDTSQVKSRLLQAAWPLRKTLPFLGGADTEGNGRGIAAPDLYSPVWVRMGTYDTRLGIYSSRGETCDCFVMRVLRYSFVHTPLLLCRSACWVL